MELLPSHAQNNLIFSGDRFIACHLFFKFLSVYMTLHLWFWTRFTLCMIKSSIYVWEWKKMQLKSGWFCLLIFLYLYALFCYEGSHITKKPQQIRKNNFIYQHDSISFDALFIVGTIELGIYSNNRVIFFVWKEKIIRKG